METLGSFFQKQGTFFEFQKRAGEAFLRSYAPALVLLSIIITDSSQIFYGSWSKEFRQSHGKTPVWEPFSLQSSSFQPCYCNKKGLHQRCFPVNLTKLFQDCTLPPRDYLCFIKKYGYEG